MNSRIVPEGQSLGRESGVRARTVHLIPRPFALVLLAPGPVHRGPLALLVSLRRPR